MKLPREPQAPALFPIFFDVRGRRSRVIVFVSFVFAALALAMLLIVGVLIIKAPLLPSLQKSPIVESQAPGIHQPFASALEPIRLANSRSFEASSTVQRFAYLDPSDEGGLVDLKQHAASLDGLFLDRLRLNLQHGLSVVEFNDRSAEILKWKRSAAAGLKIYAILTSNLSVRDTQLVLGMGRPGEQPLAAKIADAAVENGLDGVAIALDVFSGLAQQVSLDALIEIASQLHLRNKNFVLVLSPSDDPRAVAQLSDSYDFVLFQPFQRDDIQPSALLPQGRFEALVKRYSAIIDPRKLIVAIGILRPGLERLRGGRACFCATSLECCQANGSCGHFRCTLAQPGLYVCRPQRRPRGVDAGCDNGVQSDTGCDCIERRRSRHLAAWT